MYIGISGAPVLCILTYWRAVLCILGILAREFMYIGISGAPVLCILEYWRASFMYQILDFWRASLCILGFLARQCVYIGISGALYWDTDFRDEGAVSYIRKS